MRVVTPRKLTEYSRKHSTARIPLMHWYEITREAKWNSKSDILKDFNTVDYVGNNRFIFNIKGNDYRLVAIVIFASNKMYIRFIGSHSEYDKIDAKAI